MIRVVTVDDDPAYRDILRSALADAEDVTVVSEFSDAESFLASDLAGFDVLLLDIEMPPGMSGVEALPSIRERWPAGEIVMLTNFSSKELLFEAMRNGASGYLKKTQQTEEQLQRLIRRAAAGETVLSPSMAKMMREFFAGKPEFERLTSREEEVLALVAQGLTNKQIAERLYIGPDAVNYHIKAMHRRLHLANRILLAVEYTRRQLGHGGIVQPRVALESNKPSYKSGERISLTATVRASGGNGNLTVVLVVPPGLVLEQSSVHNGDFDPDAAAWTVPLDRVATHARLDLRLRGSAGSHVIQAVVADGTVPVAATHAAISISVS